jgi:hypothetical protein
MDLIIIVLIVILLVIIARVIIANQQKIQAQASLKKKKVAPEQPDQTSESQTQPDQQQDQNTTEAQNELVDRLKDNTEEIIDKTNTYVIKPLVNLGKNPVFWGSLGVRVGIEATLKLVIQQASRTVAIRIIKNVSQSVALPFVRFAAKLGSEEAAKLGVRLSAELAERAAAKIATETAEKLAEKAAIETAEKVGEKAAVSFGSKLAAKASTYASTGPIGAALLAFDVLSMGLDLGDALTPNGPGYARMGTNELYFKIRDQLQEGLQKQAEPDAFPIIVSPLDKLTAEQYQTFISLETSKIMDLSGQTFDPIILPFITAIRNDLISGELQQSDLQDEAVIQRYTALIDDNLLMEKVFKNLCISHGGINVLDSKGNTKCSYASKEKCDASHSDPLKDSEAYTEWRNGQCVFASNILKEICRGNKIPYNSEKGTCDITEEYCKTKGADWAYNDKIQDYDCMINKGQEFAEFLFGTTVTRGLKQTFDPQQYTKCKSGSEDLGYSCATCNDPSKTFESITGNNTAAIKAGAPLYLAATGVGAIAAPVAYALTQTGFCFDKCKPGYRNALGVCWEDCGNKEEVDDGAFCRKPLDTYVRGAGRIPDKQGCEPNQNDTGTDCWVNTLAKGSRIGNKAPCGGPGERDDGTSCWGRNGTISASKFDRTICNSDENKIGETCYKRCPDGYKDIGLLCEPPGGARIVKNLFDRQTCRPDEDKVAGLCYPKCKDGFFAATPTICSNGKGQSRAKSSYTLPPADMNYTIEFKKRQTVFSTKDN